MLQKKSALILLILLIIRAEHVEAKSNLTNAGDILQIAIPAAAFGVATYNQDYEGQKEFAISFATIMGITYIAKYSLKNTSWSKRPNGGSESFPSGHTASAFGGAFFLQQRYGIIYGAPAIALAALTGYSRVKGDYHHSRDVIGSTIIAASVNYFLVNKYNNEQIDISADIGKDSAMLNFRMNF